jgi:anti-sigma factor RsiW
MKCNDYKKMIYLFNELSESEKKQVQQHIADCPACYEAFDLVQNQNKIIKQAFKRSGGPEINSVLTNRIMHAIEKTTEKPALADRIVASIQSHFVRYSFAAVSLLLIASFVAETQLVDQYQVTASVNNIGHAEKTIELNSKLFLENYRQNSDNRSAGELTRISVLRCIRECKSGTMDICEKCKPKTKTL